jgi:hypothetical protein
VQEFHARQILIKPSELMTPEQAHQKAMDLYNQIINKHEDFAKLAKENSKDDTTANNGGDMGWFQQQDWGSIIGQHMAELKDDQVSQPFQSEAGWHILQRLGARQSDRTDEIERNQARQAIGNRKAEQAYDDYLREMRSSAYVNILVPELRATSHPEVALNKHALPRLAVTAGEPAGIGPELLIRLAATSLAANFVAITDRALLERAANRSGQAIELIDDDGSAVFERHPGVLRVHHVPLANPEVPGQPDPQNALHVLAALTELYGRALRGGGHGTATEVLDQRSWDSVQRPHRILRRAGSRRRRHDAR